MDTVRYSARIESYSLGEGLPYDALVKSIVEFTARAAVARAIDESDWEHEQLRRKGLEALQVVRNGKAIWADPHIFEDELAEARREHLEARFKKANVLDPDLYARLDRDVRARWRSAGYQTPSLRKDMKKLFGELQRDASDRAAGALEALVTDILAGPLEG